MNEYISFLQQLVFQEIHTACEKWNVILGYQSSRNIADWQENASNVYFLTGKVRMEKSLSHQSLWRNRRARSAVNWKVGGSNPPRDDLLIIVNVNTVSAKAETLTLFIFAENASLLPVSNNNTWDRGSPIVINTATPQKSIFTLGKVSLNGWREISFILLLRPLLKEFRNTTQICLRIWQALLQYVSTVKLDVDILIYLP